MTKEIYDESNLKERPWWKNLQREDFFSERTAHPETLMRSSLSLLTQLGVERGTKVNSIEIDVGYVDAEFFSEFMRWIESREGKTVVDEYNANGAALRKVFLWNDGLISISRMDGISVGGNETDLFETGKINIIDEAEFGNDTRETVSDDDGEDHTNIPTRILLASLNQEDIKEVLGIYHSNRTPLRDSTVHENPGYVYMLAVTMTGVRLIPVGLSGKPLLRENYDDKACGGFDRAVRDINDDSPRGRLVLLEGPPGTGKTHMVRGFMNACPNARFVFIQPQTLEKLADPSFIPSIITEMDGPGPIVLVLEDADACLSDRKANNMSSITAMLNLSDGILGSLFDLRILATTNTNMDEFDKALLRPGRLSERVYLGKLDLDQSKAVWERMAGNAPFPAEEGKTLAEIYSLYFDLSQFEKDRQEIEKLRTEKVLN